MGKRMNRLRSPFNQQLLSRDAIIVAIIGCSISLAIILAGALDFKWLIFILISIVFLSLVPIFRERERFFVYAFFFSLPIGLNFNPIYVPPTVILPLNGTAIYLYDVFFFFLLFFWMFRVAKDPQEKVRFYPFISVPYLLICLLSFAGIHRSSAPDVVKFFCLWKELEWWLVFLYLANSLNDRKLIRGVIVTILITMVIQALVGFAQAMTGGHIGLGSILGETERTFREARTGTEMINRVGAMLGSPNTLSLYLDWILLINLSLLFAATNRKHKFMFLIPVFLIGLVLDLLTFSRGGWVSFGIGGTITFWWCLSRWSGRKVVSFIVTTALVIVLFLTTVALIKPFRSRLFEDDYGAAKTRIPMAFVATNMISDNPWLGVGLINYTHAAGQYDFTREAISYIFPYPVHNEFLLIAAELGLPALGLFIFILIVVFVQTVSIAHSSTDPPLAYLGIGFFGGLVAWCVHQQFEASYVFISIPVIWGYVGLIQAVSTITKRNKNAQVF